MNHCHVIVVGLEGFRGILWWESISRSLCIHSASHKIHLSVTGSAPCLSVHFLSEEVVGRWSETSLLIHFTIRWYDRLHPYCFEYFQAQFECVTLALSTLICSNFKTDRFGHVYIWRYIWRAVKIEHFYTPAGLNTFQCGHGKTEAFGNNDETPAFASWLCLIVYPPLNQHATIARMQYGERITPLTPVDTGKVRRVLSRFTRSDMQITCLHFTPQDLLLQENRKVSQMRFTAQSITWVIYKTHVQTQSSLHASDSHVTVWLLNPHHVGLLLLCNFFSWSRYLDFILNPRCHNW